MTEKFLSFSLPDEFIKPYSKKKVNWGFPVGGGNSLGELTYISKYSRKKADGKKERWHETCRRVVEGMYSILKDHCMENRTPWNEYKAQKAAQDAYERLFSFKWTPPGRGLWMMGTEFVNGNKNSASLQNCSFLSTEKLSSHSAREATLPFIRLMEMSMLGVGVGFDTAGAGSLEIHQPNPTNHVTHVIEDSREGWYESLGVLLESFFFKNRPWLKFDYSQIRPAGLPIKGFGGIAAGPDPLIELHKNVRLMFSGRAGERITSTDIVDLMNMIGKCVVAGNVRRSAEIALGLPSDNKFLDLKSFELNPDRMGVMTDLNGNIVYDQNGNYQFSEKGGWGFTSNNSLIVEVGNTNYDEIAPRIEANGEPGLLYLDLCQQYGRLIDPPNNKDRRVAGTNPCVTGDTWVLTNNGPRQVTDLLESEFEAVVDGNRYNSTAFWKTGDKEVYELSFSDGRKVKVTEDHKILTVPYMSRKVRDTEWVEARNLQIGDKIVLNNHRGFSWEGSGGFDDGYVIGHLIGDGTFSGGKAKLTIWDKDPGVEGPREELLRIAEQLGTGPAFKGWSGPYGNGWNVLSTKAITELAESFGVVQGNKVITPLMERGSSEFTAGVLRGLFDTDGSVQGSHEKGMSIRLGQASLPLLEAVQRMLGRLGINSNIYYRKDDGESFLPDGRGGYSWYDTKAFWELIIANDNIREFEYRIGFTDTEKQSKLLNGLASLRRNSNRERFVSVLVGYRFIGVEPVYDATVNIIHAFDANGLYVHNCSEQSLENSECCTLVETYISNHDSFEDYKKTLKQAYLYGKAVTLMPTHWPETNEVMQRNRRIGCSMTGVAQFVAAHDWVELRKWMNAGYVAIEDLDRKYSEWLGVRESIKKTSIKPSGTVSILAGVTPGVHFPTASGRYIRRIRYSVNDPMATRLREAGYYCEPDVQEPDKTLVFEFPTFGPEVRDERQATMWEKTELAVVAQRYWADNQVSVTVTFTPDETDQIADLLQAKEGQLKSISFLPLGEKPAYAQMPYEKVSDERFDVRLSAVGAIDFKALYAGEALDAEGEKFCSNDTCTI